MTGTGHSGATVTAESSGTVLKTGGHQDLATQARLMRDLGSRVCPEVYSWNEGNIFMEELYPLEDTSSSEDILVEIYDLLSVRVWPRPDTTFQPVDWRIDTDAWTQDYAPWIPSVKKLYDTDSMWLFELTHGDPTLANAMMNGRGELRLIDPCPPRPGVPPLHEVDIGKLYQSIAGWEGLRMWGTPSPILRDLPWPWEDADKVTRARQFFWAAFHCARVTRHSTGCSELDGHIRIWSRTNSEIYVQRMLA